MEVPPKQIIDEALKEWSDKLLNNFKEFAAMRIDPIIPFAVMMGRVESGEIACFLIPMDPKIRPLDRVGLLKDAAKQFEAYGFVLAYDGYTSGILLEDKKPLERKDSILVVWDTKWNNNGVHIQRYGKSDDPVSFEELISQKNFVGTSIYQSILHGEQVLPKSQMN